jgi:small-conductance mechanosensitive channel/CRP-like cAMP-binding protein
MIFALIAAIVLAALRFWAPSAVEALFPAPYGGIVLHGVGVAWVIAIAFLIDRLIRALFWNRYLRRRRGRETPALVEDLVTVALLLLGLSLGLYFEEGLSVTGLVTASGATAIILGIALQVAIQDLFSGLSINLDGSYVLGDWLTVFTDQMPAPLYGCVTGITWRTTFLTLEDGRRLMVPNHMMTSQPVLNHSQPAGPKRYFVEVSVDNRMPFKRVHDALLGEAYKVVTGEGFARKPEPTIVFDRLGEDGCYYHVRFYAYPSRIEVEDCRSIMLDAMLNVILQNQFASPVQQLEIQPTPDLDFAAGEEETRAALKRAPLFARALNEDQIADLAAQCTVHELPKGAVLMRQNDPPAHMYIILEGAVSISIAGPDGKIHEVAVSATGDAVGEMSLMTGAPRTATATVLAHTRVLEITKSGIESLLQKTPGLAERFSTILAQRQRELDRMTDHASRKPTPETDILARMKAFFSNALRIAS